MTTTNEDEEAGDASANITFIGTNQICKKSDVDECHNRR